MSFFSLFKELFQNLNQQRLRSFLTIFGIMWGTATLILLLAFGTGFRDQQVLNMRGMGDQLAIMFPGRTTMPFDGYGIGRPIRYKEADAKLIADQVSDIDVATPEYMRSLEITYKEKKRNSSVGGVYPVYQELRNTFEQKGGRWLNERDQEERRRVIFLGNRLAENLFGEEDPLGKTVMVANTPFKVIGVMQEKIQNSSYNQQDRDRSFIPASTFSVMMGTDQINNILYVPSDPAIAPAVMDQVYEVMARRHRFDPKDRDAIGIWDTNEFWAFINTIFLGINGFLGMIGFFTLAVGGIGVANIMFVVVQERMKEIGIRRSVGAKGYHIMGQFFLEAFVIVGLGASMGYVIGYGLIQAMQNIPIEEFVGTPYFSPQVGLIALGVLGFVGFAAGLLPAWRASKLNVVECLRQ
ncbi:ABC transporter permease [Balneola sp. MJW-20]|uniref:ABC transporter permease n=1 Tax=Gracilimonas aurantiaca TaxID=3234185 RepID=UPI003464FFE6